MCIRDRIHALQREGWKLERQRRADARIKEAKRLKLKDQLKPDQATQNGTETEHLHRPQNRTKIEHLQTQNESKTKVSSTSLKE